jgi:protein O-GlcNAc transferase
MPDGLAAAAAALEAGDAAAARQGLTAMLAVPDLAPSQRIAALRLRARAAEVLRDLPAALADLEGVARLTPQDVKAWSDLGVLRAVAGDSASAITALRRSLALDGGNARNWNNLGSALWASGTHAEAVEAFTTATGIAPNYAHAFVNLGSALRDLGRNDAAARALEHALELDPLNVAALGKLASLRHRGDRLADAIGLYARAVRAAPQDAELCALLARAMTDADDLAGARRVYAEAVRRNPALLRARIGGRLLLPSIYVDAADVERARGEYAEGLAALESELPAATAALGAPGRLDALRWSNFLLAYQGEDDRPLQERYARLVGSLLDAAAPPHVPRPRRGAGERTRIGFASAFFRDGTVGRYFASWITGIDRARYDVTIYDLRPTEDALVTELRAAVDTFRALPASMPSAVARAIEDDAPDVLVYPELGMDSTTFVLAARRLAPLQCAGWGHPVTTGHAAIDVFFSSDAMEPADGAPHYSETLVRLPGIGTRYRMPEAPKGATRAAFGLPEDRVLFLCPQSIFKIHPHDDEQFGAVLARNPRAMLVLFQDPNPFTSTRYRTRLARALHSAGIDIDTRVIFLPAMRHDRYLAVNTVCDAMLDTTRWSGGNTSLDAIAAGLPIVTLPGRFMRARQSAAMLRLMGIDDLIAADAAGYLDIATRIAGDRGWRDRQAALIVANRPRIFDDPQPVPALYAAIERLLPEARARFG